MKKKQWMVLAVVFLLVSAGIYYVLQNKRTPNLGIDESIVNEDKKQGSTSLNSERVLVVYFSNGGTTQKLAKELYDQVGGDFRRLEPVNAYPIGDELFDVAKEEQENDGRVAIKDLAIDMDQYDTIFIGYPIWWYTYPQMIPSFFDAYDVSQKTIIPFVTHGGSGMSGTKEDMQTYLSDKNVTILDGLAIHRDDIEENHTEELKEWLQMLGLIP